jgi:hypothetical protein
MKPPSGLTPEQYMKWRHAVIKKHGKDAFKKYGIALPERFHDLSGYQQELFDSRVEELVYNLTEEYRMRDECELEKDEFGFVEEEQWKMITKGKIPNSDTLFKVYQGRNYELEFVRAKPDIILHILLKYVTIGSRKDVFETLIGMMTPFVPTYWRVILGFAPTVNPCCDQNFWQDRKTVSSYNITFKEAIKYPGALGIINSIMKKILTEFVLPQHMA